MAGGDLEWKQQVFVGNADEGWDVLLLKICLKIYFVAKNTNNNIIGNKKEKSVKARGRDTALRDLLIKKGDKMNLVTVYCERDCIYIRENKCSNTEIEINSDGCCENYVKEEMSDYQNPDSERP